MGAKPFRFNRVVALILGLLISPLAAGALSLSDVRTQSRNLAQDSGSSRRRFSDTTLTSWINECQRQAVVETRPILKASQFELVTGTTFYSLPSDFFQINRVKLEYDVLEEKSPEGLDKTDRWETTGARPTSYFINFSSRTKMGVYPFPSDSSSTGTVRYEYFAQATDLSSDSDVPFNSITEMIPYHYILAYCAAAKMSLIDGRNALAAVYMAEYKAGIERIRTEAKSRPNYRPSAQGRKE